MPISLNSTPFIPYKEQNDLALTKEYYASLSQDAYHVAINPNYKHITYDFKAGKQLTGYFARAHIFAKKETGECHVIIAHRGTNSILDLGSNINIFLQNAPEQIKNAKAFTKEVEEFCKKKDFNIKSMEHTGHSLGAVLAGIMGAINNQKATLFDSPGLKEIIGKIGFVALENARKNITIYNGRPNPINMLHTQVGNVIVNKVKTHAIAGFM